MKVIDLFFVYLMVDPFTDKSILAGVFVSYENAVRCRNMLITKYSDIPCYIVKCKSDRIVSSEVILDVVSNYVCKSDNEKGE